MMKVKMKAMMESKMKINRTNKMKVMEVKNKIKIDDVALNARVII